MARALPTPRAFTARRPTARPSPPSASSSGDHSPPAHAAPQAAGRGTPRMGRGGRGPPRTAAAAATLLAGAVAAPPDEYDYQVSALAAGNDTLAFRARPRSPPAVDAEHSPATNRRFDDACETSRLDAGWPSLASLHATIFSSGRLSPLTSLELPPDTACESAPPARPSTPMPPLDRWAHPTYAEVAATIPPPPPALPALPFLPPPPLPPLFRAALQLPTLYTSTFAADAVSATDSSDAMSVASASSLDSVYTVYVYDAEHFAAVAIIIRYATGFLARLDYRSRRAARHIQRCLRGWAQRTLCSFTACVTHLATAHFDRIGHPSLHGSLACTLAHWRHYFVRIYRDESRLSRVCRAMHNGTELALAAETLQYYCDDITSVLQQRRTAHVSPPSPPSSRSRSYTPPPRRSRSPSPSPPNNALFHTILMSVLSLGYGSV
jgi:hypothetical protein